MIFTFAVPLQAAEVEDLKGQITERNQKIKDLELEIAKYEADLAEIGEERQTLESAVGTLDLSRKKLSTDIQITENRITSTNLQIREIGIEIVDKVRLIEQNSNAVSSALRRINELESQTLIEAILTHENLTEFWDELETLQRFQTVVRNELKKLTVLKNDLEGVKTSSEKKKKELTGFKLELGGQKEVLDEAREEKSSLLSRTKNEESEYQKLLNERKAAREQFEQELFDLESQLAVAIDPKSIPAADRGVLRFPFDNTYMQKCPSYQSSLGNIFCVTQFFGNTKFATKNPQVYGGSGHNGADFRAPTGTKIRSSLSGVVSGTGNTDLQRGCFSYGKWILVKHNNGLSTLYAHLSHISVSTGASVDSGDLLGYSGNTGYSTGPHLHFAVFATDGVQIVRLGSVKKITNCGNVQIPIAPRDAYLNPLSYL
ncbi:MAG: peptidoglycan DD-metalloendopeptidase family protein [Parcubacteria group bacterium]|nr:peptidoglycan DD-metalloendopeptidase family protein [Parcubacteria group bacterium]